jgi:hypothetical protein
MWLDDCPKLPLRVLKTSGALGKGVRSFWGWPEHADGLSIEVTGGDGVFTIGPDVRVVVTKRTMVCPRCGASCLALVLHEGWGCTTCCLAMGCNYRCNWHPGPLFRRGTILRQLARADPLSLKAFELKRKLKATNRMIAKRARYVGDRIARSDRG